MPGTPICDCACCRTGCGACDPDCLSREAELIDDDGYNDYLTGYGRRTTA